MESWKCRRSISPTMIVPCASPIVMREIADRHVNIPLISHRMDEFSSGLQSSGNGPHCISLKLRYPVFTERIQPVDSFTSINNPSYAMTDFSFCSALVNFIVASWSSQLIRPQIFRKFVGALPTRMGGARFKRSGSVLFDQLYVGVTHWVIIWMEVVMGRCWDLIGKKKQGCSSLSCQSWSVIDCFAAVT